MTPRLIQIQTGTYSYFHKYDNSVLMTGHVIYGLDEDSQVWKFIPTRRTWIKLEDSCEPEVKIKVHQ